MISVRPGGQKHKLQLKKKKNLDSCPLWFKHCMIATCFKKIIHSMICATLMFSTSGDN